MRQRRRSLRLIAIFLGLSMLAAACGDDDDTEASDDTTEEEDSGAEGIAAPEFGDAAPECTGEADGMLKVGGLLPQTGNLAFLGPPEEAGAQLAVNEVNAAGGVLGQPIEYSPGDSGDASTDIASQTVDRHLNEGADLILGAASSGVSFTVIDKIVGRLQDPVLAGQHVARLHGVRRRRPLLPHGALGRAAGPRAGGADDRGRPQHGGDPGSAGSVR